MIVQPVVLFGFIQSRQQRYGIGWYYAMHGTMFFIFSDNLTFQISSAIQKQCFN
jgi:drug/metabolite transporter superfamily protein YnfA